LDNQMPTKALLPLFVAAASIPGLAAKHEHQPCIINYSILEKDTLGNVNQGVSKPKNLKWLTENLEDKYPGVCYVPPDPSVKVVLVVIVTPATYHGTKIISNNETTNGTINADDGSSARYSGTTTSSTAVPYSFDYGKFQLTVETAGPNHTWIAHHRFALDGIYPTMYGIPLGGRLLSDLPLALFPTALSPADTPPREHRSHRPFADRIRLERDRQCSVRVPGAGRSYERTTDESRRAIGLIRTRLLIDKS
jgi:hypothetical protein